MTFCANCGKKLPEKAYFCSRCGMRTGEDVPADITPWEDLRHAFTKMGEEIEKALTTAGKEMEKAFETVRERIGETTSKQPDVCSSCGENNPTGSRFCHSCGKDLRGRDG